MFVSKTQIIYILAVITFLSSCITSEKVNYMQKPGFNIPAYKDSIGFGDYRLRAGDRYRLASMSLRARSARVPTSGLVTWSSAPTESPLW